MAIDRKALIRQYKDTTPSMGVGVVRNKTTGLALVVAGRDLPSLLNRHRAQLRLNAHTNRQLQSDWNSLGADAFEFAVLDVLTPKDSPDYDPTEDLRALEGLWIEKLKPFAPGGYHLNR